VLSREVIVDAAIKVADAEGLDAASIRRVAARLGVRPMSLYTHIERKDDLLALMADQASAEALIGPGMPDGWRQALTAIAWRSRQVALRHPWVVDIAASNVALGPNGLRHLEESLTAIRELGLAPRAAFDVLTAVDKFVLGHLNFEALDVQARLGDLTTQGYVGALLASGEFPELSRALPALTTVTPASPDAFERGLTWLLDGIEASVTAGGLG
jgi:AcrR family transcriptional regulator